MRLGQCPSIWSFFFWRHPLFIASWPKSILLGIINLALYPALFFIHFKSIFLESVTNLWIMKVSSKSVWIHLKACRKGLERIGVSGWRRWNYWIMPLSWHSLLNFNSTALLVFFISTVSEIIKWCMVQF